MGRNAARDQSRTPSKEADLYSWAMRQAELLRAGRLSEIDPVAIAEEIDDVGEEQYDKLESALRILMLHLLEVGQSAGQTYAVVDRFGARATTARFAAASKKPRPQVPPR